ncbi:MAG: hypothetical protein IPN37_00095 [Betaproteobacteria bacterium]|nr:hypothetical protein [Betaproteobacteria bacterium]
MPVLLRGALAGGSHLLLQNQTPPIMVEWYGPPASSVRGMDFMRYTGLPVARAALADNSLQGVHAAHRYTCFFSALLALTLAACGKPSADDLPGRRARRPSSATTLQRR